MAWRSAVFLARHRRAIKGANVHIEQLSALLKARAACRRMTVLWPGRYGRGAKCAARNSLARRILSYAWRGYQWLINEAQW